MGKKHAVKKECGVIHAFANCRDCEWVNESHKNFERIFGPKPLSVWKNAPPKEEPSNELPGDTKDGTHPGDTEYRTRNQADGRCAAGVPQEPGRRVDSPTAEPVGTPLPRNSKQAAAIGMHPLDTDYWTYSGYRGEFTCPHGVGHGNHIHGCCETLCCQRDDFPLKKPPSCRHCGSTKYTPGGGYCDSCGGSF